jgi:hypothetical protein
MSIDRNTEAASQPVRGWCVNVAVSVLEHVPRDVVSAWMSVESFADRSGECWPDNATLAKRMDVGSVRSARRALLKLVEYGILKRFDQGGNRRKLVLLRRAFNPITGPEWASLLERGEARTHTRQGRTRVSSPDPKSF